MSPQPVSRLEEREILVNGMMSLMAARLLVTSIAMKKDAKSRWGRQSLPFLREEVAGES